MEGPAFSQREESFSNDSSPGAFASTMMSNSESRRRLNTVSADAIDSVQLTWYWTMLPFCSLLLSKSFLSAELLTASLTTNTPTLNPANPRPTSMMLMDDAIVNSESRIFAYDDCYSECSKL